MIILHTVHKQNMKLIIHLWIVDKIYTHDRDKNFNSLTLWIFQDDKFGDKIRDKNYPHYPHPLQRTTISLNKLNII